MPISQFQPGGPGKDGIPALDRPRFARASAIGWLADREPVIELSVDGETRAYPLQILIWHEIVNDRVGGMPVAVTFCRSATPRSSSTGAWTDARSRLASR